MNSTRIVPVTSALIEEALEYYWRATPAMKLNPNEEVHITYMPEEGHALLTTTKEVVEVFRI